MTVPPGNFVASPKIHNESIVRRQISQYASKTLGLRVQDASGPIDPDSISIAVYRNTDGDDNSEGNAILVGSLADGTIEREEQGVYITTLSAQWTAIDGLIDVHWSYTVAGAQFSYLDYYQITEPMPFYEGLTDGQKFIVEQVTWMMGDLFDSTTGGPHLVEEFQTHFGYERLAHLLSVAVARINSMSQPLTNFIVGAGTGGQFPERFNNVLFMALYVETIKHMIRSYVEQPNIVGAGQVAYTDRRDYMQRWQQVLQEEQQDLANAIRLFKRKQMGLGSGSMIVAGGIYGNAGRQFRSGGWAAQTRGMRFYPTSFVLPVGGGSGAYAH